MGYDPYRGVELQIVEGRYATVTQTASASFRTDMRQGKSASSSGVMVMARVYGKSDSAAHSLRLPSGYSRLNGTESMVPHKLFGIHPP